MKVQHKDEDTYTAIGNLFQINIDCPEINMGRLKTIYFLISCMYSQKPSLDNCQEMKPNGGCCAAPDYACTLFSG